MTEIIVYRGVNIEIFEVLVGLNRRLDFRLTNAEGKKILFGRNLPTVVNYSTNDRDALIKDACREIDTLIQTGQITA